MEPFFTEFASTLFAYAVPAVVMAGTGVVLALTLSPWVVAVDENKAAVTQKFSRYYKTLTPGYNLIWNRGFVHVVRIIDTTPQIHVSEFEARTPDNAFPKMKVTMDYTISGPSKYHYGYSDPQRQIEAVVKDEFINRMATTGLAEAFISRAAFVTHIRNSLQKSFEEKGITINKLVPDIPDPGPETKATFGRIINMVAAARGITESRSELERSGMPPDQAESIAVILHERNSIVEASKGGGTVVFGRGLASEQSAPASNDSIQEGTPRRPIDSGIGGNLFGEFFDRGLTAQAQSKIAKGDQNPAPG